MHYKHNSHIFSIFYAHTKKAQDAIEYWVAMLYIWRLVQVVAFFSTN